MNHCSICHGDYDGIHACGGMPTPCRPNCRDGAIVMTEQEMADHLVRKGWRVKPPLTQENCPHHNRIGNGSLCSDGSGTTSWYCYDCGKSYNSKWGPSIPATQVVLPSWS